MLQNEQVVPSHAKENVKEVQCELIAPCGVESIPVGLDTDCPRDSLRDAEGGLLARALSAAPPSLRLKPAGLLALTSDNLRGGFVSRGFSFSRSGTAAENEDSRELALD